MNIKKSVISGTKWTVASMVVQVVVQLLRLSILTRFLTKSDFGLVAIVTLILGFTHIFTDLGVSVVLFSRHDLTKKEYSSLYWVSFLSGIALYVVLLAITPAIALFYKLDILNILIPIMGLDLIFATAGRHFKIFKQKEFRFKEIGLIEISSALLSLVASVYLAYFNWGVYSLIYSTILNSALTSFLLIITTIRTYPISFYINIKENKSLYKVGLYQTGAQILDFISSQLDIIIIGRIMGSADLGVYNLVKQLILRPYSLLNPIIQNVAIPLLAKLRNDVATFNSNYLQILKITSMVTFPLYALIALYAKEILWVLYGAPYKDAALLLQIFCVWGGISSILGPSSMLVVVTGKTKLGFNWTIFRVLTTPACIIIGGLWGTVIGISVGQSLCIVSYLVMYWIFFIKRASTISFKDYTASYLYELGAAVGALTVALIIKTLCLQVFNLYVSGVIAFIAFGTLFCFFNKTELANLYKRLRPS
ncbi:MOP flippase family protein [Chitinophaga nivalis]|uniref:MOP flippase family protein n=1 Tax=Chitinophaga nivalis TaxID=2991709 RepID=A0ABT3IWA6_9BACT|nr:MOP flippase family protein [Chitinophaga nivalis]MCW3462080.1 MOP flippase family protein [Chitinophaga nivalis]MCW3488228.1 MOP flippase family protein [Chitinophaga nivalis]